MKMLPKSESVPMTSHNCAEISKVKNYLIVRARITVHHKYCSFSTEASKNYSKVCSMQHTPQLPGYQ